LFFNVETLTIGQMVPSGSNSPLTDVSSNPVHGEVYSIYNYVINFVSYFLQAGSFLRILRFHPPIKLTAMILQIYG